MGILDDAIREHLELIRSHGTPDTEVQRLEDEAFGPPTRPDEADFPELEEGASSGNGVAVEELSPEDAAAHEDVTTLLPAEEPAERSVEEPGTGLEEPTGAHITGDVDDPEGEPVLGEPEEEPLAEVVQEEPAAEEHPIVEEAPSEEHPAHEPEGAVPLEPPIESLDTVEHPFPEEIAETEEPQEEAAPSDERDVLEEEPEPVEPDEGADGSDEERGEDVLADTPEFLKDQPEDDELWFEQREPKDFDF